MKHILIILFCFLSSQVFSQILEANDDEYFIDYCCEIFMDVLANDIWDGPYIPTIIEAGPAQFGEVFIDGDFLFYQPLFVNYGVDQFQYVIQDQYGNIATGNVLVNIFLGGQLLDDIDTVENDEEIIIDVFVNDIIYYSFDQFELTVLPQNGMAEIVYGSNDPFGKVKYIPNPGFVGNEFFSYSIMGNYSAQSADIIITVIPPSIPDARDDFYEVTNTEQSVLTVLENDSLLVDHYIVDFNQPQSGTVSLTAEMDFLYIPDGSFIGYDTFEYAVYDSSIVQFDFGTVVLDVQEGMLLDIPLLNNQSLNRISPNPFHSSFELFLDQTSLIKIYNSNNQLIFSAELFSGLHNLTPTLQPGIYWLQTNERYQKIIKL